MLDKKRIMKLVIDYAVVRAQACSLIERNGIVTGLAAEYQTTADRIYAEIEEELNQEAGD